MADVDALIQASMRNLQTRRQPKDEQGRFVSREGGEGVMFSKEDRKKTIQTPAFKKWFGDWELASVNARFNADLANWQSGRMESSAVFRLGLASDVLSLFDVPPLQVQMPQSVVRKALEKHGVAINFLRGLPHQVQAPLAVFASKSDPNSRILLTEIEHPDGNLVVALALARSRGKLLVNDIRSVYPKPGEKIDRWIDGGLLLGVDEERGRHLLPSTSGSDSRRGEQTATPSAISLYDSRHLREVSRVVDANGEPLVVYHGTVEDIDLLPTVPCLRPGLRALPAGQGTDQTDNNLDYQDGTQLRCREDGSVNFVTGDGVFVEICLNAMGWLYEDDQATARWEAFMGASKQNQEWPNFLDPLPQREGG